MGACTAFGVKSSATVAGCAPRSPPPPQEVTASALAASPAATSPLISRKLSADAVNFGAVSIGSALGGKVGLGMLGEFIGTFMLVFTIIGVAVDPRIDRAL